MISRFSPLLVLIASCSEPTLSATESPPKATIVSPTDQEHVIAGALELIGTATDSESKPSELRARWFLDGELACEFAPPTSDSITTCLVDVAPGEATAKLEVLDANDSGSTAGVTFVVDSATPSDTDTDTDADTDTDTDTDTGNPCTTCDRNPNATLYTVDGFAIVYEVDPVTAVATPAIALGGVGHSSVAIRPSDGLTLAITGDELDAINLCSGGRSLVGTTGVGNIGGMTFGAGEVLYGLDIDNDQLVTLDPITGVATVVGPLGFDLGNTGMAYDCACDILYGLDGSTAELFQIDPATGATSNFVPTTIPFNEVGLEIDTTSGQMYAGTGFNNQLYTLDPATGASALIGLFTGNNLNDLIFHECP